MSDLNTPAPLRSARSALCTRLGAACMLAASLTACGGSSEAGPAAVQAQALAALPDGTAVLVQGCVVDESFLPQEGVPVRVLAADGRLLGNARSGRSGEFQLRLPADARVALQVDADGGESMTVHTPDRDQRFDTCLQARAG